MEIYDCECPHCKGGIDVGHEDVFQDDESREVECPHCEKVVIVTASYTISYGSRCRDGEHKFMEIPTMEPYFECSHCGKVTQHPANHGDIDAIKKLIGERPDVCDCGCGKEPKHGYQPKIIGQDATTGKDFTVALGGVEVARQWNYFQKRKEDGHKIRLHWD